jgi:hypothetical protein
MAGVSNNLFRTMSLICPAVTFDGGQKLTPLPASVTPMM